MPQPYPTPEFNTTTQMMQYVSVVTDGMMFPLVLLAAYLIIFLILKGKIYRTSDCLLVTGFLTFILASMFWAGSLVAGKIVVLFLLLTLAGGIYSIFDK